MECIIRLCHQDRDISCFVLIDQTVVCFKSEMNKNGTYCCQLSLNVLICGGRIILVIHCSNKFVPSMKTKSALFSCVKTSFRTSTDYSKKFYIYELSSVVFIHFIEHAKAGQSHFVQIPAPQKV